jgi:hypothetical protein
MTREHPIEPELNASPPREVRYRDGFKAGCGAWIARVALLPHTLVGIFFLGMALNGTVQYVRMLAFGVECEGRIVKKTATKGGKGGWHYDVEYAYPVNAADYTAHVSVNRDVYDDLAEGEPVAVRALESDPERAPWVRVRSHSAPMEMLGPWCFALFWNGIMSLFLWPLYGRPMRYRRLVRIGEPTVGVIIDVSRRGTRPPSWKVWYEYQAPDPDGLTPIRRTGSMVVDKATTLTAETPVSVLYDPTKPKRSVVYALANYRAV